MLVGYERVSTSEQDTALQLVALRAAGCAHIYEEKKSAVKHRPEFERLLSELKRGDLLVVYKLDRLARSLSHLLSVLERLKSVGAGLRSLTEPIDTSSPAGLFTIQVLGAAAEFERSLILERSAAGRKVAQLAGVHCGRPRTLTAEVEADLVTDWASGLFTFAGLAKRYGVHSATAKRAVYRVFKPGSSSLR